MARRTSKEIWELIHKRLDASDVLKEKFFPDWLKGESREEYLARVKRIGSTPSQILRGVEEGLLDMTFHFLQPEPWAVERQRETLEYYRERTGRYLFDDVPDPRRRLRKVLERGRLRSEDEWRMLDDIMSDLEQSIFQGDEIDRVNRMLADFEARLSKA